MLDRIESVFGFMVCLLIMVFVYGMYFLAFLLIGSLILCIRDFIGEHIVFFSAVFLCFIIFSLVRDVIRGN